MKDCTGCGIFEGVDLLGVPIFVLVDFGLGNFLKGSEISGHFRCDVFNGIYETFKSTIVWQPVVSRKVSS